MPTPDPLAFVLFQPIPDFSIVRCLLLLLPLLSLLHHHLLSPNFRFVSLMETKARLFTSYPARLKSNRGPRWNQLRKMGSFNLIS